MKPSNPQSTDEKIMIFKNTEHKIDQLISYFNDGKINLSPVFQRGHVWTVSVRKKLIANIVQGKPIPAIFLYKDPKGNRFSYNILDGKQRLESLILFIGNAHPDIQVANWGDYFFPKAVRKTVHFDIDLPEGVLKFSDLDSETVRELMEYPIPTVEITLTDNTNLDEIISLFVDINQQGVKVDRFTIVKAMNNENALLRSVFNLIAIKQNRGSDIFYKGIANEFSSVLKTLTMIANSQDNNIQVDRIWERLLEIALFLRDKQHKKPVEVLKRFIKVNNKTEPADKRLTLAETNKLRTVFKFLKTAYKDTALSTVRFATDQTHFYTMIISIISGELLSKYSESELIRKIIVFGNILDKTAQSPTSKVFAKNLKNYLEYSTKQTTDVSRRQEREKLFLQIIEVL